MAQITEFVIKKVLFCLHNYPKEWVFSQFDALKLNKARFIVFCEKLPA